MLSRWLGLLTTALRLPLVGNANARSDLALTVRPDPVVRYRAQWAYVHLDDASRAFALVANGAVGGGSSSMLWLTTRQATSELTS